VSLSPYVKREDLDAIIDALFIEVERLMDSKRCPKCRERCLELMDKTKTTGIFECVNANCSVRTFDPTFREEL